MSLALNNWAQDSISKSVVRLTADTCQFEYQFGHITFMEFDHEVISTAILLLPLIQEKAVVSYCYLKMFAQVLVKRT